MQKRKLWIVVSGMRHLLYLPEQPEKYVVRPCKDIASLATDAIQQRSYIAGMENVQSMDTQ